MMMISKFFHFFSRCNPSVHEASNRAVMTDLNNSSTTGTSSNSCCHTLSDFKPGPTQLKYTQTNSRALLSMFSSICHAKTIESP